VGSGFGYRRDIDQRLGRRSLLRRRGHSFLYESFKASDSAYLDFFVDESRLDHFPHRYPKPYVAFFYGITMGGGLGLGQAAASGVVTERTRMAMPEVGIRLCPDVGGSYFRSRLPDSLAVYLALAGSQLRASGAGPHAALLRRAAIYGFGVARLPAAARQR
jgi:enoyl-CoA hydratase/carnithine racemase